MKRSVTGLSLVAFATAALLFGAASDAFAQQKPQQKRDRRCAPDYLTVCQKACSERGGQVRFCPTYCAQQQREARCSG